MESLSQDLEFQATPLPDLHVKGEKSGKSFSQITPIPKIKPSHPHLLFLSLSHLSESVYPVSADLWVEKRTARNFTVYLVRGGTRTVRFRVPH